MLILGVAFQGAQCASGLRAPGAFNVEDGEDAAAGGEAVGLLLRRRVLQGLADAKKLLDGRANVFVAPA